MNYTFASCFGVVAAIIFTHARDAGIAHSVPAFSDRDLLVVTATLPICTAFYFLMFLRKIDSKYLPTFYSRETGKQFACSLFRNLQDDGSKDNIFTLKSR